VQGVWKMRRGVLAAGIAALLGVALVQDRQGGDASLQISTDPHDSLVNVAGPQGFVSVLDLDGPQTLAGLDAGEYLVVATAEGHSVAQSQIALSAGAAETLTLALQPLEESIAQAGGQQPAQQQPAQQQGQAPPPAGGQVAGGAQAGGGGEQVYGQMCAQCHGQQGEGGAGPALAGNQNLQDPQMVLTQILQGGGGMPPFADQLSDEQVAAVATHEMNSWGNSFGEVTAEQVAQARGGGQAQGGQQGQAQQGQQQQDQGQQQQQGQQQPGQQPGQQQPGQPAPGGQAPAGGEAQQAGGAAQQPDVQVQQAGQQARVEITVPTNGVPVSLNVQVEVGAETAQAGAPTDAGAMMGQAPMAGQQMGQAPVAGQQAPGGGQQMGQAPMAGQPGEQQQAQQQAGQQPGGQQQQVAGGAAGQQGWFSETQAQAGMQAYLGQCSACHGGGLEGRPPFPPLTGEQFLGNWSGRPLAELFDYISSEMPDDRPGELDERTYAQVTAYVLQQNGFPAGEALEPRSDRLEQLTIGQPQGQGQSAQQPAQQQDQGQAQQPAQQQDQGQAQQPQAQQPAQQQDQGQAQQPAQQQAPAQQAPAEQPQQAQQQPQQQQPQQAAGAGQAAGGGQAQQPAGQAGSQEGQQVYAQQCASCHGQQGEGGAGPALAGNQNLQDSALVVTQIIQGGGGMPAFGNQLSDEQIAAVATHEMNSWGNGFGQVTPEQVTQARGGGQGQQGAPAQEAAAGEAPRQQAPADAGPAQQAGVAQQQEGAAQQQAGGAQQQVGAVQQPGAAQQQAGGGAGQAAGAGEGDPALQGTLQIDWVEPAGAVVTVQGPGGFSQEFRAVGGEVVTGLAPGTYSVSATSPGFESSSIEVEIEADRTARVTLVMQQ
jgi:mono/diheme cytochrome c family protein